MKICAQLSILILLSSCIVQSPKVESAGFTRTAPMMWDGEFPKEIKISEDFPSEQRPVIENMALSWNTAVENKMTFFKIGTDLLPKVTKDTKLANFDTDGIFGVYYVAPVDMPNASHDSANLTIAVTVLKIQTQNYGKANEYNKIFYADIYVKNNIPFRTVTPPTESGYNSYDLNNVLVHEFGHALGLEHAPTSKASVMVSTVSEYSGENRPLTYDVSQISYKYNIPTTGGTSTGLGMAITRPNYVPDGNSSKPFVKLVIELRKDGECIHAVDGKVFHSHKTNLN